MTVIMSVLHLDNGNASARAMFTTLRSVYAHRAASTTGRRRHPLASLARIRRRRDQLAI